MSYMKRHLEKMAEELAERDNISLEDAIENIMDEAEDDEYSFEEKDEDQ